MHLSSKTFFLLQNLDTVLSKGYNVSVQSKSNNTVTDIPMVPLVSPEYTHGAILNYDSYTYAVFLDGS